MLLRRETFNSDDLELGVFVADLSRFLVLRRIKPSSDLFNAIPLIDDHEEIFRLCPVDTHGNIVREMTTAEFSRGGAR
jgi:hypothetical protein